MTDPIKTQNLQCFWLQMKPIVKMFFNNPVVDFNKGDSVFNFNTGVVHFNEASKNGVCLIGVAMKAVEVWALCVAISGEAILVKTLFLW